MALATCALDDLLTHMAEVEGSDLHLKPMRRPHVRLNGRLQPIAEEKLPPQVIAEMLQPIVPDRLRERLEHERAVEFGYGVPGVARFRAAVFYQRGTLAAVLRRVAFDFPSLEDWGMPGVLSEFCFASQGLVLVTGPTGSGKSSTLAGMVRHLADRKPCHIVTIEDPIEFLMADAVASISQREIGTDTPSFSTALRNSLRQDPDVIMVGEMRDEETVRTVLTAAETGHLVLSTLHTNDAVQTVDRIVNAFPKGNHDHVRQQLAAVLEAVVCLQLVPRKDGNGMVAAVEILRRTPQTQKLIQRGDFEALNEEIRGSVTYHRMQSMNQSLASLVIHGTVDLPTALEHSTDPSELDLLLRKTVGGMRETEDPGADMAECTSDFSKIVELQEVKRLYDDLQDRFDREIENRDREIASLKAQVRQLDAPPPAPADDGRLASLETENRRLTDQLGELRTEYEAKLEKFQAKFREFKARASQEPEKKGFFRR